MSHCFLFLFYFDFLETFCFIVSVLVCPWLLMHTLHGGLVVDSNPISFPALTVAIWEKGGLPGRRNAGNNYKLDVTAHSELKWLQGR